MSFKPRERTMPLVPEPFDEAVLMPQSVFDGLEPISKQWRRFCPNLDIPRYRESLSEEKKSELDRRANTLYKRVIVNQIHKASEFCWEVCAWHDVFGLIMDDEGLRMDKRPYEFLAKDDSGQRTVRTRIPDATFGLKSYDSYYLKRGYICTVPGCTEDHSNKQPDKRLSEASLRSMMHNPDCGLIVDGVWGKADLVFPFAVYEAKKRASDFEAAESQIYHACKMYLAMLDDLARNPDNAAEYQTEESSEYQLFAFTSCGPIWEVLIAWNFMGSCSLEPIWRGDITEVRRAYDLVCIVDQIHEHAVKRHRHFVMKHLEAWHARHRSRASSNLPGMSFSGEISENEDAPDAATGDEDLALDEDSASDEDGAMMSDDSDFLKNLHGLFGNDPEWLRLKKDAKSSREIKAQTTRARNRELRKAIRENAVRKLPERKTRWRLRSTSVVNKNEGPGKPSVTKRGRDRPAKGGVAKTAHNKKPGRPRKSKSKAKA